MIEGIITFFIVFIIGFLLFRKRENPYIKTHKRKWQSEKDYLNYLHWLSDNGGDLPLDEVKFKEDEKIIKEITNNFK